MKRKLLILSFAIVITTTVSAQWINTGAGISTGQRIHFSLAVVNENVVWSIPNHPTLSLPNYEFTKTIDGGVTWVEGTLPDTIGYYSPVCISALNEDTAWVLFLDIIDRAHSRIFKTLDGGVSWMEQQGDFNMNGHCFATFHFFNANEGIGFGSAGTGDPYTDSLQIFRTHDGGQTWNRISPATLPAPMPEEGVWIYSGNNSFDTKGDTLWFGTRAGRIFRTTDKGVSWEAFATGISGNIDFPGLSSVAFENSLVGIATTYQPALAVKTLDGGVTWNPISMPTLPYVGAIAHIPGTTNTYITGNCLGGSATMNITFDGGDNWQTNSFTPAMTTFKFISPTVGYGGRAVSVPNNLGLYKWTGDFTSSLSEIGQSDKINFYPNPASDILNLFSPEPINGKVIIADVAGRVVKEVFINGTSMALDIKTLEPGLYVIEINLFKSKFIKH